MQHLKEKIASLDWMNITASLNERGFTHIPNILDASQCEFLKGGYVQEAGYRKTVEMARYRFGAGQYKYWDYPLPDIVTVLRESLYTQLAPIANGWMDRLGLEVVYPETLDDFLAICHKAKQEKPTPLILRYDQGGYNTLHQDLYGEVFFPIQIACFLSDPNEDYSGGEFVLTEQVPRAQSKATVLKPDLGDIVIFATNFRPVKGMRGYYRAKMRHGVSEILDGQRYTMGLIFHDALK